MLGTIIFYLRFMCSSVSTVNNTLRTFHSFIWMTASFSLRLKLANRSGLSGRKRILAARETARALVGLINGREGRDRTAGLRLIRSAL